MNRTATLTGRKPACVTHAMDCLLDAIAVNDDDQLNDGRTLALFDGALRDGVIDSDEALGIRPHLLLDHELTRIQGSLTFWGAHAMEQTAQLVDQLRSHN